MDRSLKARLIGASVLVLLVVLVVPELLSGRKAAISETPDDSTAANAGKGQMRTYTIELGKTGSPAAADANLPRTYAPEAAPLASERPVRAEPSPDRRDDTGSRAPVAVAARDAGSSAATSGPPAPTRAAGGSNGVAQAPSAPAAKPRPAATGATPALGTWSVQVGAFGSAESAGRLVKQLEADGFSAYVSAVERNGKSLHRVRVGPEPARAAADALAGRLKARGLPVALVAND
jgi:DedD protein